MKYDVYYDPINFYDENIIEHEDRSSHLDYTYSQCPVWGHMFDRTFVGYSPVDFSLQYDGDILKYQINEEPCVIINLNDIDEEYGDEVASLDDIQPKHQETLDPLPQTTAGQARFFYYGTDQQDVKIESKDFDDMYEHQRENELDGMTKEETPIKNNLSFGSRPATAQTNDEGENSMVNMGQLTIDRKNKLIGNKFQSPDKNQHSAIKLNLDQTSDSQLQA